MSGKLSEWLCHERGLRGCCQWTVAKAVGTSGPTIGNIEKGDFVKPISPSIIRGLADFFQCPIEQVLEAEREERMSKFNDELTSLAYDLQKIANRLPGKYGVSKNVFLEVRLVPILIKGETKCQ